MGKIMMNGIQYGVGGITDAEDIKYDNTQSGMSATNVQGAVDELKSGLADTNSALSIITNRLKFFTVKSTNPFTMSVYTYTSCILLGFAQGIGSVLIGIAVTGGGTSVNTIDLLTGQAFSNAHLTISVSNGVLTISSDIASNSSFAILAGGF